MNPISKHFFQVTEALTLADEQCIQRVVDILKVVKAAQGTVWLAGNGGSSATASHAANDLTKMGKVKALALSDFVPTVTAYGNDEGWDSMFAHALEAHIGPKDAVIGISCSGNSANVISFLAMAKSRFRIGFTGPGVNRLTQMNLDVVIRGMSDEITVIEDVHSMVFHAIARSLMNGAN